MLLLLRGVKGKIAGARGVVLDCGTTVRRRGGLSVAASAS